VTAPFPLIGEPLALDLVNTRTAAADLLVTPERLTDWLAVQAERFAEAGEVVAAGLDEGSLQVVRSIRDRVARAVDAARHGEPPQADDLAALAEAQRAAPAVLEVAWDGARVVATRSRTGDVSARLGAWLAEAGAEFLADPAVTRVRQCAADDCVLVFLPAHPRRIWCSAARCGNRVRVARHYHRSRSR
jgi:Conserved protein containing a Zn-ribbon-like motif, possibly RNA-binding